MIRGVNPTARACQLLKEAVKDLSFFLASWPAILRVWFSYSRMREKSPTSIIQGREGRIAYWLIWSFVIRKVKAFLEVPLSAYIPISGWPELGHMSKGVWGGVFKCF